MDLETERMREENKKEGRGKKTVVANCKEIKGKNRETDEEPGTHEGKKFR